jgi:hypothetical protein
LERRIYPPIAVRSREAPVRDHCTPHRCAAAAAAAERGATCFLFSFLFLSFFFFFLGGLRIASYYHLLVLFLPTRSAIFLIASRNNCDQKEGAMLKAMSNVYSLHYKLVVTPDVTNGFCCVQCRRCTTFSSVRFFPTSYPKAARFQQLTTWSESKT